MLRTVPIDYVFDDDDYVGAGAGRYHINDFKAYRKKGESTTTCLPILSLLIGDET
jgi:hypothetical protein